MISIRRITSANLFERTVDFFRSLPQEKVTASTRLQVALLLLVLAASAALCLSNYNSFQLGSYMDDASYAVLAKSIASADSYGLINVPGNPDPTRYPFGFPLALSALVWLFPSSLEVLKVISLLATLLNIVLIFWGWPYLSSNGSRWWGVIIAALYALSPLVIGQTKMVMSEPYFTTLTLIGLILTERYLVRKVVNPVASVLTGMILVLALFTRNIGIVLIAAVAFRILVLPIEKATKQKVFIYLLIGGAFFLAAVIALTPITIRSLLPIEYMDQFRDPHKWGQDQIAVPIVPRVVTALEEYVALHLRTAVIPIGGGGRELEFGRRLGIPNLPLLTGSLIGIFILLGILSAFQYRELSPTVLLFEIMYLAAILFWPWRAPRFLYPVIPFLFYNFLIGLKLIFNQLSRIKLLSRINTTAVGLAFVIFALSVLSIFKVSRDQSTSLEYVRDLRVGAVWLKENSGKDDLVMAQQPQGIYLYSERKTMDFPQHYEFKSAEDFESIVRNRGVNYIVIAPDLVWREDGLLEYDSFTGELILPIMNELNQTNSVEVVYSSEADKVIVYKVNSR